MKTALKETLSKNSLDYKSDIIPLKYEKKSCAEVLA